MSMCGCTYGLSRNHSRLAKEVLPAALLVKEKKDQRYVCSSSIIMSNLLSEYS
jgi:hypothetical protein